MKIIKNKNGLLQLIIVIIIASVFVTSLILIQNHYSNQNIKINRSIFVPTQTPTPTNIAKSTPTPYKDCPLVPIQQPCEILRGCVWINGKCYSESSESLPTRIPLSTPTTSLINMDIAKWATYTMTSSNISFKYPTEWGNTDFVSYPYWVRNGKKFLVDTYIGYNFDDPEEFLKLYDVVTKTSLKAVLSQQIVTVGTHKGVTREENRTLRGLPYKYLTTYFTDESHYIYAINYEISEDSNFSSPFTDQDRQIYNMIVNSFKSPSNPNIKVQPYSSYKDGCTSLSATGCIASGKCCYGKCNNNNDQCVIR